MSLIANNGGLLWHFLRGIALAAAQPATEEPTTRIAETPRRSTMWDAGSELLDDDTSRVPLSPAVLASGVFVAAVIEEDAERWDGLA